MRIGPPPVEVPAPLMVALPLKFNSIQGLSVSVPFIVYGPPPPPVIPFFSVTAHVPSVGEDGTHSKSGYCQLNLMKEQNFKLRQSESTSGHLIDYPFQIKLLPQRQ
jgi:hypothetical protein